MTTTSNARFERPQTATNQAMATMARDEPTNPSMIFAASTQEGFSREEDYTIWAPSMSLAISLADQKLPAQSMDLDDLFSVTDAENEKAEAGQIDHRGVR